MEVDSAEKVPEDVAMVGEAVDKKTDSLLAHTSLS